MPDDFGAIEQEHHNMHAQKETEMPLKTHADDCIRLILQGRTLQRQFLGSQLDQLMVVHVLIGSMAVN